MSISVTKRRDAVLRLLRSDFDIDGTVQWVMLEFADEPAMQRAKNKEALARNIVTIGSQGDQQSLNMVAFQQALAIHAEDQRRKYTNVLESDLETARRNLEDERNRNEELGKDYRAQVKRVQDIQEQLSQASESELAAVRKELTQKESEPEPAIR